MSDRVTWERCPRCGRPAAVGWTTMVRVGGAPPEELPEEFDCTAGCHLEREELRRAFGDAR